MLCINNPYTDVYFNLAIEEYLLKNSSRDIFLLWQNEPSVIVGKHQNIETEINLDFVREKQIKIARRISGGGAVYHDPGNLNFSFIENINSGFDKYTKQMIEVLGKIGIRAQSDERHNIFIDGLKISGSAQCIHKNRQLFHATLLYSSSLENLTTALQSKVLTENPSTENPRIYVLSVKSPVTNISEHLHYPLGINELKDIIMDYFLKRNPENKIGRIDELLDDQFHLNILKN